MLHLRSMAHADVMGVLRLSCMRRWRRLPCDPRQAWAPPLPGVQNGLRNCRPCSGGSKPMPWPFVQAGSAFTEVHRECCLRLCPSHEVHSSACKGWHGCMLHAHKDTSVPEGTQRGTGHLAGRRPQPGSLLVSNAKPGRAQDGALPRLAQASGRPVSQEPRRAGSSEAS